MATHLRDAARVLATFGAPIGMTLGHPFRQSFIRGHWTTGIVLISACTFFVPEGTGRIVENARDVKVIVSLSASGNAVIKQVLVDGAPFDPGDR